MSDFMQVKARLEKAGVEGQAAEWLIKALNPATPGSSGTLIPDAACDPVATPEFVVSTTVNAPAGASWDCMIIKPPTFPLLAIIVTGPVGTNFAASWTGLTVQVMQTEPATSAVLFATAAQQYIMGAVNSTPVTVNAMTPSSFPLRWRATSRSSTEYLVASDLNNQGTVTSGAYPTRLRPYRPWVVFAGVAPLSYNYKAMLMPLNESDMTTMNPKVRVAPAKTGVYQPIYNAGPTFEWATADAQPPLGHDSNYGGVAGSHLLYMPSSLGSQPDTIAPAVVATIVAPQDTTTDFAIDGWATALVTAPVVPANPYTYGTSNELCGVSIYRGLSASAAITIKVVLGLELVPMPTSPIRQFTKTSTTNDPRAIQLYYELVRDMPQSYPAASNFFSTIVSGISRLLPTVVQHLPAVLGLVKDAFFPAPPAPPEPLGRPLALREYQPEMRASATSAMPRRETPRARPKRPKKKKATVVVAARRRSMSASTRGSRASRRR